MKGNKSQRKDRTWQAILVLVVVMGLVVSGCVVEKPKVYRVGILIGSDAFLPVVDGFKAKMTELGYVEGKSIVYDVRAVNPELRAQMEEGAQQLVDDKVDLILTVPTEPAIAAKAVTQGTNIPVVFAYAGIEGSGLVNSVREPGGNTTGVRFPGPEQTSKRLELLLEVAPQVKRVWIGYLKNYPNNPPSLAALRPAAASKGVTLVEVPVNSIEELEADLAARAQSADLGIDAMLLMPDILNHSPAGWEVISQFAAEHKVPLGGSFPYTVEQGAVFGNANDLVKVGELTASLADKIFKGTPAGSLPVVTPEQDLWINYKVAQELALTVPEGLLSQAAQIIR